MCYNLFMPFGTLQIMVGLFNIGLGPGRTCLQPGDLTYLRAAYWLGAVFIAVGIMTVLSDCYRSYCLMRLAVFMNIVGFIFGILACVLYSADLNESFLWQCDDSDNCRYVAYFAQKMLTGMDITLIVMAGLQVWVSVCLTVSGFRSFCCMEKEKSIKDVELQKPLLKSDLLTFLWT